jgi:hypothetical protein
VQILALFSVSVLFAIGLVGGLGNPISRKRSLAVLAAWCLGGVIFLGASYEGGVPAAFVQPVVAAFVSAVFVVLSLLAGLAIRIPRIKKVWHSTPVVAGSIVVFSLAIICLGAHLGLSERETSSKTGITSMVLRSDVAVSMYSLLMFAIVNWPLERTVR